MNYDDSQLEAIRRATRGESVLITGGAGTGKTTIIKEIADSFYGDVCLLAPTGKAAAQIRDRTGHQAYTIHRELQYDGVEFRRKGKIKTPVIIDESSMVDSFLMAKLLHYAGGQVVFVGDVAQLEPVGPGAPFHDLIRLRPDMVCTLTTCHRASGAIHKAAQAIRAGERPHNQDNSGGEAFQTIGTGGAEETTAKIIGWVKAGKYDPFQDMILAPVYGSGEDDGGIDAINAAVKAIVNPSTTQFSIGDRVLCNKNFSDKDMWNGDVGTITAIDVDGHIFVKLDRSPDEVFCEPEQIRELSHAYCVSVHKAQGSQARRVFFVCLKRHLRMLSRRLIYTGITRARSACVVCGQIGAFYQGISNHVEKTTIMQCLAAGGKSNNECA